MCGIRVVLLSVVCGQFTFPSRIQELNNLGRFVVSTTETISATLDKLEQKISDFESSSTCLPSKTAGDNTDVNLCGVLLSLIFTQGESLQMQITAIEGYVQRLEMENYWDIAIISQRYHTLYAVCSDNAINIFYSVLRVKARHNSLLSHLEKSFLITPEVRRLRGVIEILFPAHIKIQALHEDLNNLEVIITA